MNGGYTNVECIKRSVDNVDNRSQILYFCNSLMACQTQTTLRAAKVTKTAGGPQKYSKILYWASFNQNWRLKMTL